MRGGEDSRIPAILSSSASGRYEIVIRTYDFNPELAAKQIASWVDEFSPDLLIGESLGSVHALSFKDIPVFLVSPALNTAIYFRLFAFLTWIPGVTALFDYHYRPKSERRQRVHFSYRNLKSWMKLRSTALSMPRTAPVFAFFGSHDHYRKSGIVSIATYHRFFGNSYSVYDGTHYMEEEYIHSMLIPAILRLFCQDKP